MKYLPVLFVFFRVSDYLISKFLLGLASHVQEANPVGVVMLKQPILFVIYLLISTSVIAYLVKYKMDNKYLKLAVKVVVFLSILPIPYNIFLFLKFT